MDSHVYRKAANRLPALADLAVLRFNTRGTESEQGTSEGEFGDGETERWTSRRPSRYAADAGLPGIWLLGWSFGTELTLRWGLLPGVPGRRSCCPRRCAGRATPTWTRGPPTGRPLTVLVPELDDYLRPDEARQRFARVPKAEVIGVDGAKHLWVGETYVRIVLNEIVRAVNPAALSTGGPCRRPSPSNGRPQARYLRTVPVVAGRGYQARCFRHGACRRPAAWAAQARGQASEAPTRAGRGPSPANEPRQGSRSYSVHQSSSSALVVAVRARTGAARRRCRAGRDTGAPRRARSRRPA